MEALQKLLLHELSDLYSAEQQLVKALPKLIQNATSRELQQALKEHLSVTEKQVKRLDQAFEALGEEREEMKCKGMAGLVAEGEEIIKEGFEDSTQDAGIIGAAQRVEHYEIAAYGTARTLAQTLRNTDVARLLEETLEEEKEADQRLTQIAESVVNAMAASEEDEEESEKGGRSRSMASAGAGARGASSRGSSASRTGSSSSRSGSSARAKSKSTKQRNRARERSER
jgi:ferritin-like metal-binding protein YciE